MGYLYLVLVALFFSFGGISVKLIRPFFNASMITFMRFFAGVLWLLCLKAVTKKRFRPDFRASFKAHWKWLAVGSVACIVLMQH